MINGRFFFAVFVATEVDILNKLLVVCCGNKSRYFKAKQDLFLTLTNQLDLQHIVVPGLQKKTTFFALHVMPQCVLPFPLFHVSDSSRPPARVNKSYVNANVKGSISAADRKQNHHGFFYSSIINEGWRLIYRLITRLHKE